MTHVLQAAVGYAGSDHLGERAGVDGQVLRVGGAQPPPLALHHGAAHRLQLGPRVIAQVVVSSFVPALAAGVLLALLARFTAQPVRVFQIVA